MTPVEFAEGLKWFAGIVSAVLVLTGAGISIKKWYVNRKERLIKKAQDEVNAKKREDQQDADIKRIKEENCLMMYGLSACLDGLLQQGCNHSVPRAKEKIDKYLNQMAHK